MSAGPSHARSLLVVLGGSLGQIAVQFALQVVLARTFGVGFELDAYQAAFTLPMALVAIVAGPLGIAYVPTMQKLAADDDPRTAALLGTITATILLCGTLGAVCGVLYAEELLTLQFPGFTNEQIIAAAVLFRLLIWSVPVNILVGLFQTALNTRLNFVVPAVASILGPAVTVVMTWSLAPTWGIAALAWGVLAGSMFSVVLQGAFLVSGQRWPRWTHYKSLVRQVAVVAAPAALSMMILRVDPLVDGYVLAAPEEGSLSQWGYALRIVNMFLLVSSGVISTVAFPRLARSAMKSTEALIVEVRNALRLLIWVSLPVLAVMMLFSTALVHDLLQRGKFVASNTAAVANLLAILSGMVLGAGLGELSGKTFYARLDTRTPFLMTVLAISGMAIAKLLLVAPGDTETLARINCVGYLASAAVQIVLLGQLLSREIFRGLGGPLLRCGVATVATALWGSVIVQLAFPFAGLTALLTGTLVYFGCLWISGEFAALPLSVDE